MAQGAENTAPQQGVGRRNAVEKECAGQCKGSAGRGCIVQQEAGRQTERARGDFHKTDHDLHPAQVVLRAAFQEAGHQRAEAAREAEPEAQGEEPRVLSSCGDSIRLAKAERAC